MDWSALVGLPWRDRGRDEGGVDCWGLSRLGFTAGTGIELPSHADHYTTAADRAEAEAIIDRESDDWREVETRTAREFDLALFRSAGSPHVALIVRPPLVLNIHAGGHSAIIPMRRVTGQLQGVYRHKSRV